MSGYSKTMLRKGVAKGSGPRRMHGAPATGNTVPVKSSVTGQEEALLIGNLLQIEKSASAREAD